MTLPSKELLSAIWDKEISGRQCDSINQDDIWVYGENLQSLGKYNIHELAHKVKKWAIKNQGWTLQSYCNGKLHGICRVKIGDGKEIHKSIANSEPEAIFRAGEWILQNKE